MSANTGGYQSLANPSHTVSAHGATTYTTVSGPSVPPRYDGRATGVRGHGSITALRVFAILALILGLLVFVLNCVTVGNGSRLYFVESPVPTLPPLPTVTWAAEKAAAAAAAVAEGDHPAVDISGPPKPIVEERQLNYFPGIWLGLVEVIACIVTLIFCHVAMQKATTVDFYDFQTCLSVWGGLTSAFYGFLAAAAFGAASLAFIYVVVWISAFQDTGGDCTYVDSTCVCLDSNVLVTHVPSCSYVSGTLYAMYTSMCAFCGVLVILNIVIASLYCGVLCCCRPSGYVVLPTEATSVVVVNSAPPNYGAMPPQSALPQHSALPPQPTVAYPLDEPGKAPAIA